MNKIFKLKPFTAYWFYAFKITYGYSPDEMVDVVLGDLP